MKQKVKDNPVCMEQLDHNTGISFKNSQFSLHVHSSYDKDVDKRHFTDVDYKN